MIHRMIAIGDIHGCALALERLIAEVNPGPEDTVVPLGDYIDRGHDSKCVLDQLLSLGGRCRLVPLLGNHEQMLLDARSSATMKPLWLEYGGIATLQSYGDILSLDAITPEHIGFLESCRDYLETDTHIFVHASYFPNLRMAEQPSFVIRWESLHGGVPGPHHTGKTVVVGHTPQRRGRVLDLGYLKCIDTYCYGGGWLTALDVATGQIWQADVRGQLRR